MPTNDLLNLQVVQCPPGFDLARLESRVQRTFVANQAETSFRIEGNRHGQRSYECLYRWIRNGHWEYGFQIHFILGSQIFSIQLNSRTPIEKKGDERLVMTSAFADSIRVPYEEHEPESKPTSAIVSGSESSAMSHYRAVLMLTAPPHCHLTMLTAKRVGIHVVLQYRWAEDLTQDDENRIHTCVRAFINASLGSAALAKQLAVRLEWGDIALKGVPVPLWHLSNRNQATSVVDSTVDHNSRTVRLVVGTGHMAENPEIEIYDQVAARLCDGLIELVRDIDIKSPIESD